MYGYDDASWRDYAWALSMIDGCSTWLGLVSYTCCGVLRWMFATEEDRRCRCICLLVPSAACWPQGVVLATLSFSFQLAVDVHMSM